MPCRDLSLPSLSWLRFCTGSLHRARGAHPNTGGCPWYDLQWIDLVIAALGEDVKGYLLALAFSAQMGTVRIFPLLFTQGFLLFFRDRAIIWTPNFSDCRNCEVHDPPPKPQGRQHREKLLWALNRSSSLSKHQNCLL